MRALYEAFLATVGKVHKGYLIIAAISVAAGLNFIFLTPPFMPLSIDKWLVGITYLVCGLIQLTLLLFNLNRSWLRLSMAASVGICAFWAVALTYDFFARSLTSLQLPIFVSGFAGLGLYLITRRVSNGSGK